MKDIRLWLCVYKRALNNATANNQYPLPLITEMIDESRAAWNITKLNLWSAYHFMRMTEGDEYKYTFRIHDCKLEY